MGSSGFSFGFFISFIFWCFRRMVLVFVVFFRVLFSNWYFLQLPCPNWPGRFLSSAWWFSPDPWIDDVVLHDASCHKWAPRRGFILMGECHSSKVSRPIEADGEPWWFPNSPSLRGELRCCDPVLSRVFVGFVEVSFDVKVLVRIFCSFLSI